MVEEQINNKLLSADLDAKLPPDEGKTLSQFQEKFLQLNQELRLQLGFMEGFGKNQKLKT